MPRPHKTQFKLYFWSLFVVFNPIVKMLFCHKLAVRLIVVEINVVCLEPCKLGAFYAHIFKSGICQVRFPEITSFDAAICESNASEKWRFFVFLIFGIFPKLRIFALLSISRPAWPAGRAGR